MSKRLFAVAAVLAAFTAALPTAAEAEPCDPSTQSSWQANTCIGSGALSNNSSGPMNTAIGSNALNRNTSGRSNTASGWLALQSNTIGAFNTASGASALQFNNTGSSNTASGVAALYSNTTGNNNTADGVGALYWNVTGSYNTASGRDALTSNSSGSNNAANGVAALYSNSTGNNNTAIGVSALSRNTMGSYNIALGYQAGSALTGHNNIAIGNPGLAADMDTIRLGNNHTRAFIAGIRGVTVTGGQAVVINANGQLGVVSSSRRYKQDIQPMGEASSPLMQLRPVTFHYKKAEADGSKPMQYGLIAEEVEQVMPGLVVYNKDGSPESVAYHLLPSLLLNEYQKQGRELTAAKNELAQTTARLEAMDAELAALKLAVSRFAAAPSPIQLAASKP